MFKNYLKIAFRNLRKNKSYSAINILGLAIGLGSFILLLLYVNYEHSYDKWSPELKNVYQVNELNTFKGSDPRGSWNDLCDTRVGTLLRNRLPGVNAVTMVSEPFDLSIGVDVGNKTFLGSMDSLRICDSSFFKVFPHPFIAGNPEHALDKLHSMVLTESLAHKWFGTTDIIGRSVKIKLWWRDPGTYYEITGVVKNTTAPTSIPFSGVLREGENDAPSSNPNNTHFANIYVKINQQRSFDIFASQANKAYDIALGNLLQARNKSLSAYIKSGKRYGIRFQSLQDVHLHPVKSKSVMDKIAPAMALSILLLLIAIINFANLATAQVMQRSKEAGVRKVLGANKKALIFQFLVEVAVQCIIASLIALLAVMLFLPFFSHFFDIDPSYWAYHHAIKTFWWQLMLIIILTTLIAGIYPALFLAGYNPVKVLKGNSSRGTGKVLQRNILIVIQFLVAAVFITGIIIIQKQVNYMANADLGFRPDGLIDLKVSYNKKFIDRLKTIPGVKYIGTNSQLMGSSMDFNNRIRYNGEEVALNLATVSMGTFKAMKVKILKGRSFSPQFGQDTVNTVILNQSAARLLGGNVIGKSIYENGSLQKHIVGIIADYHYEGFDKKVLPTVYALLHSKGPTATMNNLLVRISSAQNPLKVISKIKKEWNSLYPGYPLEYVFMKHSFHQLIADDIRFKKMVGSFALLSIILSLIGIFALSAFMTRHRKKEISIRKVLGASISDILRILNKEFLIPILIANIIAWPVAYLLAKHWLNGFAYRTNMSIWPFIITTAILLILTILTVSIQSWTSARMNPVDALKYE